VLELDDVAADEEEPLGVLSAGSAESEDPQALSRSVATATAGTTRETRFTPTSVPYVSILGHLSW
jgi:hypothetical protein